jgi:ferritin
VTLLFYDTVARRRTVRDKLEHSIAAWEASHRKVRPTVWVDRNFYARISNPLQVCATSSTASFFGYGVYDAIDHHTKLLTYLNTRVADMQKVYREQAEKVQDRESSVRGRLERETRNVLTKMTHKVHAASKRHAGGEDILSPGENKSTKSGSDATLSDVGDNNTDDEGLDIGIPSKSIGSAAERPSFASSNCSSTNCPEPSAVSDVIKSKVKAVVETAHVAVETGVGTLAKEAKIAASSALKGALEATRTIELLTLGAYYKTSTTAFVTFKSRVASCTAHQVLLSHEYFTMKVKSAPNAKDILWDNVPIPYRQVSSRTSIADAVLLFGALFWSVVVGFITALANLEAISNEKGWTWLQAYENSPIFQILNTYLALGLLLILLALLPAVFDLISRSYEGIKLESEIQNSIMTRYFYYQLANVFVSVGLGSIAQSLNEVTELPIVPI